MTLADLNSASATQVGCTGAPYGHAAIPGTFPVDGNYSAPIYAVSVPGVLPSACVSAFQSKSACEASAKRLMSNAEWIAAATGTPDTDSDNGTTDCNTFNLGPGPLNVGSRSGCVSPVGIFDAVGNVYEWTEGAFGTAWIRGGGWSDGAAAGVLLAGSGNPFNQDSYVGFRCAR